MGAYCIFHVMCHTVYRSTGLLGIQTSKKWEQIRFSCWCWYFILLWIHFHTLLERQTNGLNCKGFLIIWKATTIISYRIIFLAWLLYPIVCSDIFRYSRWMFAFLSRIKIINRMSLEDNSLCFLFQRHYLNFNINSINLKTVLWNKSVFSSLQRINLWSCFE